MVHVCVTDQSSLLAGAGLRQGRQQQAMYSNKKIFHRGYPVGW